MPVLYINERKKLLREIKYLTEQHVSMALASRLQQYSLWTLRSSAIQRNEAI